MAFISNKGNNSNKINTTTKVFQMYNPEGEDASTLTLGYWNQYVTIKINPALDPSQRTNTSVYNYDTTASVVLNAETVTTLHEALKEFKREIATNGSAQPVAVLVNNNVVKVGMTSDYEGMDGQYYVGLFEVDDHLVQTGCLFYVFNAGVSDDSVSLKGWNEQTGQCAEEVVYESQWIAFNNFIEMAAKELVLGGAHGSSVSSNIALTKLTSAVDYLKSLVEMIVGKGGASNEPKSSGGIGGGFASQRRQRNLGTQSPSRSSRSMTQQTNVAEQPANSMPSRRTNRNKVVEESVDDLNSINDILKNVKTDSLDVDLDDLD